jgi:hypothetical protein
MSYEYTSCLSAQRAARAQHHTKAQRATLCVGGLLAALMACSGCLALADATAIDQSPLPLRIEGCSVAVSLVSDADSFRTYERNERMIVRNVSRKTIGGVSFVIFGVDATGFLLSRDALDARSFAPGELVTLSRTDRIPTPVGWYWDQAFQRIQAYHCAEDRT